MKKAQKVILNWKFREPQNAALNWKFRKPNEKGSKSYTKPKVQKAKWKRFNKLH